MSQSQSVIICGNGPSLGQIDYHRFDVNAEVWRVNDFYLEDKYYVGKRVDAMFNGGELESTFKRYWIIYNLDNENIYNINFSNIFTDREIQIGPKRLNIFNANCFIRNHIQEVMRISDEQGFPFSRILWVHFNFLHQSPFTGVFAILYAVVQGYKKIYLTGIDNKYNGIKDYVYQGVSQLAAKEREEVHPECYQRKIIEGLLSMGIKLFSLSQESSINEFVPLAPFLSDTPTYIPEEKGINCYTSPPYLPPINNSLTEKEEYIKQKEEYIKQKEEYIKQKEEYIKQKEEYKSRYYRRLINFLSNFLLKKEARHIFREKYMRKK